MEREKKVDEDFRKRSECCHGKGLDSVAGWNNETTTNIAAKG